MNENLRQRKAKHAEYLNVEYQEKPRKWWQKKDPVVRKTSEVANAGNNFQLPSHEKIVRYNLKGALSSGALFFIFFCWFAIKPVIENNEWDGNVWFNCLLMLAMVFYPIVKALNRKPRIIINPEGIWLAKISELVSWEHIVETYIKVDDSGESTSYVLLIHYYDQHADSFTKIEQDLCGLDINKEEIAFHIEYLKSDLAYSINL
jgi:hypothetical protein